MRPPKSTKYRRRSTDTLAGARRLLAAIPGRLLAPGLAMTERLLFDLPGPAGRGLRRLARALLGRDLTTTASAFEADFYLAQCENPRERARAALDPHLHYAAIGRGRRRSPARAFDPIHYRLSAPRLSPFRDPFAHFIAHGRAVGAAANAAERLRRATGERPHSRILVLDHARGGGSARTLALMEAALRAEGHGVVRLRQTPGAARLVVWDDLDPPDASAPPMFDLLADMDAIAARARADGVVRLLVNHTIDRPIEIFDWIPRFAARIGCPFDIFMHDFYFVCPRVAAVDGEGRYCGLAPVEKCRPCIARWGSEMGGVDPAAWRAAALACVAAADRVFAPSRDTADRLAPFIGAGRCAVWEPERDDALPPEQGPKLVADAILRVVTIGALNTPKGSQALLGLAAAARRRRASIAFHVIGQSDETAALRALGVRVHGRYDGAELPGLLAEAAPHVVFLPAIWPETWSFALTHALAAGLPVLAFDIGAPAARLRALGRGAVLPLALSEEPERLLDAILDLRREWETGA